MTFTFRRGSALGVLATLAVLLLAAVPVQADPVTLECVSARETNAAGGATSFGCTAGPTRASAPGPPGSATATARARRARKGGFGRYGESAMGGS